MKALKQCLCFSLKWTLKSSLILWQSQHCPAGGAAWERKCFCGIRSPLGSQKAMAPHSSTLAWKIPWVEERGRLQSMGLLRVGQNWATWLSLFTLMRWRRKWQPTPVFLPGESQGRGSLVGCRLWGAQSQTRLNDLTFTFHFHALEKEMATHSSVRAWRIPGTGESVGLPSMGSHRVGHDWSDLAKSRTQLRDWTGTGSH